MWLNADKDTCYCTVFETPPVSQVASVLGVGSPLSGMNRQRGTRNIATRSGVHSFLIMDTSEGVIQLIPWSLAKKPGRVITVPRGCYTI